MFSFAGFSCHVFFPGASRSKLGHEMGDYLCFTRSKWAKTQIWRLRDELGRGPCVHGAPGSYFDLMSTKFKTQIAVLRAETERTGNIFFRVK
jgi:hypothetical protein